MSSYASNVMPYESTAPIIMAPAKKRDRLGDRYLAFLGVILFGYAIGSKGFAYWGVPPIFIGEITLAFGLFYLLTKGGLFRIVSMTQFVPLILFMTWGLVRTLPYVKTYGVMAFRDAVVWAYGLFAFVNAALFISRPERMAKLLPYFRRCMFLYLLITPVMLVLTKTDWEFPPFPTSNYPMLQIKGGDVAIHLTGCFAYFSIFGAGVNPWLPTLAIPTCLALCITGRAAMVTFMAGVGLFCLFKPLNMRSLRIVGVLVLGVVLLWATGFRSGQKGDDREVSFEYLTRAFTTIFTSKSTGDDMEGTKRWRMNWWTDIVNYTFHGKYFWGGKGFGINLADDDGHQLDADGLLRSPHNGHLTVLARSGVVGAGLWALLQFYWAGSMMMHYFRAKRSKDARWSGLFLGLVAYWTAYMANTSFDVFIEGPMGGVGFWNLYGFGIACMWIYKRYPYVLYLAPVVPPRKLRKNFRRGGGRSFNDWSPQMPTAPAPIGAGAPMGTSAYANSHGYSHSR